MGGDTDDHLLLKENQDAFPRPKLNDFFNLLFSFLRNHLSLLAVGACLVGTLLANSSLGKSDFGKNGFSSGYLGGKGGGGEEQAVKTLVETDYIQMKTKKDGYVSWMKMPVTGTPFADETGSDEYYLKNYSKEEARGDGVALNNGEVADSYLLASVQGSSLLSASTYYSDNEEYPRSAIIKYVVKSGDTPSSIAYSFGISTNTVLWANDLDYSSYIKPGQKLTIPPVTGVLHKVKEGDTMEKIAKKYKADAELAIFYNATPADGNLENKIGQVIVIPNGSLPEPPRPTKIKTNQRKVVSASQYHYIPTGNRKGHSFPWGYCTWYVATKRYVPWGGDAKYWLSNARSYGYRVDHTPSVGAIMVTNENRYYGHVVYVEAIHGNLITISEMNYVGFGIRSVRTISANSRVIRGFIH